MMTHYHEHYDHYNEDMILRLEGFYGRVEQSIHDNILNHIQGNNILDFGCGFGSLVNFLNNKGFNVLGIDQHEPSIHAGKKRFPNANILLAHNAMETLRSNSYDTIIVKDVIHHIYEEDDIELFLNNMKSLCHKRIIIIDPNPTFILKLCRKIIRHEDPICSSETARYYLEKSGFKLKKVMFSEFLAFPLSGGFIGPELIKSFSLQSWILKLDKILSYLLRLFKIDKFLCWRYYIVADLH